MEYKYITDYSKVSALQDRMAQLEQAHYSNTVYLRESEAVGDQVAIQRFTNENHGIDAQYEKIKSEHDRLVAQLEAENSLEDDEEADARELRGEPSS